MKPLALTAQQQRFCDAYLSGINGRLAATRAGYSPKTAVKQASRLLRRPHVQAYLAEKQAALSQALQLDATEVLQEYARIAFFNIGTLYYDNQILKPLSSLPPGMAAPVASIKVVEKHIGSGAERIQAGNLVTVRLHSKLAALKALAKHLGLFDKNNTLHRENKDVQVLIGYEELGDD